MDMESGPINFKLYLLLGLILVSACGRKTELKFGGDSSLESQSATPSYQSLSEVLFEIHCLSCHSGAAPTGDYDLTSRDNVLTGGRVIPFDPDNSPLYARLSDGSMPPSGPIDESLRNKVYEWIRRGAPFDETPLSQPGEYKPQVQAGSDIVIKLPTSATQIIGSATDKNGTVTKYGWTQISGTTVSLQGQDTSTLSVTGLTAGIFIFELTATDDFGETGTDQVQVIVNAAGNNPPTANAGTDQTIVLPVSSVTLSGVATDSDGRIRDYQWSQVSGPRLAAISNSTLATANASGLVEGVYVFQFTVTDDGGAIGTDTIQTTVKKEAITTTFSSISRLILQPKCIRCHDSMNPAGQYDLTTYATTLTQVVAGNALASELYVEVLNNSMPKGSQPLTTQEKQAIEGWINGGALNN
jgi:hypothetical protein